MGITSELRKTIHRKSWEYLNQLLVANTQGSSLVSDKYNLLPNNPIFYMAGYSSIYRYDSDEDGWVLLPASGLTGTFGAGSCMHLQVIGAMGGVYNQTATSGGVATITTNRTIVRNLAGLSIRVISGTGVGFIGTILSNTIGANSVIKTTGATTFDSTTVYQINSGSLWVQGAGNPAGFSVYDIATNTWTAKTALGGTWATDGQLVATLGAAGQFSTSTATAATSNTIVDGSKSWATSQWVNYQVRITAGAGIGQIRTISSSSATTLTVSSNWTVTPDTTSTFVIEGNDDFIYLLGNNAVTLYRFSVSAGTWTTLSPAVARSAAPTLGISANWIDNVTGWVLNSDGSPSALTSSINKQNGRYIFSFRGGATSTLDIYDIASNTWINATSYGSQSETFTTGSAYFDYKGDIYIQKENTNRLFRFSISNWNLQAFNTCHAVQGAATIGSKMCIITVKDVNELNWLYTCVQSQLTFMRVLII